MTDLEKRRNGIFTCLDCSGSKTLKCFKCVPNNWELFKADSGLTNLPYVEKSERYRNKIEELATETVV